MIKYLGSKRRLTAVLGDLAEGAGATTALDLFTGTTRVAQELKARGARVTAVDRARYSEVFARCYVECDATRVDKDAVRDALARLAVLPGHAGYFTETFCVASRFVQPFNGERIDAIRDAIEDAHRDEPLRSILLTSLIEAADRVDSTTGVQMAYVKRWAPRSFRPLDLRMPALLAGAGRAVRGDACEVVGRLGGFDVAYLDPPYNQHRYDTNYHVWETLVAWDAPEHYGIACKRVDGRDPGSVSVFNRKREMPAALASVLAQVDARVVILSYNDESWISLEELLDMCSCRGEVVALAFPSNRYVGARIGIHNPRGEKVGTVSHTRNREYVIAAGPRAAIRQAVVAHEDARVAATSPGA